MNRLLKTSLLLFFFALCGAAVVATYFSRAQTRAPAARELYSAVNRQLAAFRADDFDSAYQQAASGVQQKFSRTQFEQMIRRDFSSMTEARQVEFGALQVTGAAALVQVYLTTKDGTVRAFLYSFTAEREGWKIDGVTPLGREPRRRLPGVRA